MTTYERKNRLREALDIRGMKQVELVEKTGIKKSSINNWLAQRWQPKQDAILKMAKALDVSEMWLAGYDCAMERQETKEKPTVSSERERKIKKATELLERYSEEDLALVLQMLERMPPSEK